ncbi:hypothetical protein JOF53_003171 [Crossiella equi]|uniref:Uncharacterized protein n=1 Tax=Crossiella equi TaxID=130796 RepID=A0ABS5ACJ9_9PSEU|nr:hypothetical protein [Crossiella equi]MBP2474299.1 hypothetical protein [Crossiella equi]
MTPDGSDPAERPRIPRERSGAHDACAAWAGHRLDGGGTPAVPVARTGDDDALFTDDRLVGPPVIGECQG